MSIASAPTADIPLPAPLRRLVGDRSARPVWHNELGGWTLAVADDRYLKWSPSGAPDLEPERRRLAWLAETVPALPVPRVVTYGHDEHGEWLVTTALPGTSAVADSWKAGPATAAAAIGHGLRVLHETVPVGQCPFDWSTAARLARVRSAGCLDPAAWAEEHQQLSVAEALTRLDAAPPIDRLVVCHGDACAPNTLIDDAGRCSGHVDLGDLGVADRWADLAVATWSLDWNFGPGWQDTLLDAYGVRADPERIAYHRLLWDLSP